MLLNKDSLLITKECTLQTLITAYGVTGCACINLLLIIQNLIDAMIIYLFDVFKNMYGYQNLNHTILCFQQLLSIAVGARLEGERNCTI